MIPGARDIGVGVLAGLAAALLTIGIIAQSPLATTLMLFSPLPIMVAALGWGTSVGVVAVIAMAAIISLVTAPIVALVTILVTALPAAAAAYFTGLARPALELGGPKDSYVWYPLADTLLRVALILAAGFIIIGALIGFGDALAPRLLQEFTSFAASSDPSVAPDPAAIEQLVRYMMRVAPAIIPAMWVLFTIANLYLALRLTAASGRLRRPRDDWPRALRMPRAGLIIFAVACAGAFLPGGTGHAAMAIIGALGAGFTMAGFAMLHARTRGQPWRPVALWLAYLAASLFILALIPFFVAGLLDTSRSAPVSRASKDTRPNNDN
ncbi:YybS family protein [Phyllobacterium sp. 21LDTY02-6]|uniref:DUF2232 domain-containing protein n=1 Tax=Phyllobacterium sp. 21LDTY02-6 TaxID=2944903 RepID=UPI0020210DE3|nr:DUF2232 domain-containing protein [Phyllobacterium sp. 21LDTY02-6]MCO4319759.1 YybS family protein [Phyllobacterium sp. 21LDTY02-6]